VYQKYFPVFYILFSLLISIFTANVGKLIFSIIGIYTGWFYLRYIVPRDGSGHGYTNDEFSLSTFFPLFVQPIVLVISSKLDVMGFFVTYQKQNEGDHVINALPFSNPVEAQKRRELANKAIDMRLNEVKIDIQN
jgi:hypothetical protein